MQEALDAYYLSGKDKLAAAASLDIPRTTYQNRYNRAIRAGLEPSPHAINAADPEVKWNQERQSFKDEIRDLKSQLNNIQRDNVSAGRLREFVAGVAESLPEPPKWLVAEKEVGDAGVPLTVWSDWHIGEVVAKEQVAGLNEYNLEIARNRVRRLVETIIHLCFNHTANPKYPGIVVCLGGDMISGLIHAELVESQEGAFTEQIKETYALLVWALERLADRFGRVFVPAVVGNHGRMHHKPRAKNRTQDSILQLLVTNFLFSRGQA